MILKNKSFDSPEGNNTCRIAVANTLVTPSVLRDLTAHRLRYHYYYTDDDWYALQMHDLRRLIDSRYVFRVYIFSFHSIPQTKTFQVYTSNMFFMKRSIKNERMFLTLIFYTEYRQIFWNRTESDIDDTSDFVKYIF